MCWAHAISHCIRRPRERQVEYLNTSLNTTCLISSSVGLLITCSRAILDFWRLDAPSSAILLPNPFARPGHESISPYQRPRINMPDLLGLPPEIKALIITLIRRHSDLRACYRTCKALYEDAIPRVYSRITLNENIPVPILCSLLKHENSGLKHIRHLKVTSGLSKAAHERIKFNNVLHLLANLLPRDVLLSFMSVSSSRMSVLVRTGLTLRSLDTTRDVDPSALGILYPRQRRLQTLRYVSNIYPKLNVPCGISTDNISTIQLMIEDHFVLRGARECLLEAPMLRHLEIHVSMAAYCTSRKLKFTDGLHRATASESIIAGLMGEVDLQSDYEAWPEHRRLSSLRLHGLSLSGVGIHLVKAIDIRRLTSLSLQCCEQEDSLLRMLAEDSDHSCLQLEHLAIAQSPDARTKTSSSEALDDFLSSFDTLSSLIISAPHTAALTPDLGALANHSDTLRALYLNCDFTGSSEAYDNCYEPFAIEEYLCECKKLEQLALNFPRTYINPIMLREDEDFNDFTVRVQ